MICLSGCGINVTKTCDWGVPIYPSTEDILTDGTVTQILTHNTVGEALCGWSN